MQGPIVQRVQSLLGKDTKLVKISSLYPKQIIDMLEQVIDTGQQFLLTQSDVWRYSNDDLLLDYFDQHKDKRFFIQTVGHRYAHIMDHVWEFPIPWLHRPAGVDFEHVPEKRPYVFSSLNYRPALHRILLGYNLWKHDLLKSMIFTQGTFEYFDGYPQLIINTLSDFNDYCKLLPLQWNEHNIDFSNSGTTYNLTHDAYRLSYAYIATETETEFFGHDTQYATPTVTEKTFKCMIAGQIPIFLAAPGHLAFLEKLGMDVFYDLAGYTYNTLDTFGQINRIVEICHCPEAVEYLYFNSVSRRQHNYNMIMSGQLEQNILNGMIQFLQTT